MNSFQIDDVQSAGTTVVLHEDVVLKLIVRVGSIVPATLTRVRTVLHLEAELGIDTATLKTRVVFGRQSTTSRN